MFSSFKPMSPLLECPFHGQQLSIANIIIALSRREFSRKEGTWFHHRAIRTSLRQNSPCSNLRNINLDLKRKRNIWLAQHRGRRKTTLQLLKSLYSRRGPIDHISTFLGQISQRFSNTRKISDEATKQDLLSVDTNALTFKQEPNSLTKTGDGKWTITMTCEVSAAYYVHWYVQKQSKALKRILYIRNNAITYETGINWNKFTATQESDKYTLVIKEMKAEDEGTYYCAGWDHYAHNVIHVRNICTNKELMLISMDRRLSSTYLEKP
ncbi:unnamed protein product [Ranitomeya imitator]|uniref:Ig-like domain-containing protein n=1 Tax=Ranitomeya imitator TaxID=111125 RepID=A0ABN9LPL8_9NEOB|nr:unnamed protein product [Ranitomeya imitator]